MKLLLDTSAYSGFRRGVSSVVEKISGSDSVLISPVMLGELMFGLRKGGKFEQNMRMLRRFLDHEAVEVAPLGAVTADRYSRIVMQLKKDGSPMPINDVWIAAQAMEHGAELLTSDRHFEQVAGLAYTIC
ncbi:MAG: VapC toxin family PIN domain ribonuclease [Deltaproteobacteria bacterium CG2_30_66_27]|nr:MAG: VapC toxin family PIN domain ribonuclease [Deltaproteobacteria bacterium CG2_30_66_27]